MKVAVFRYLNEIVSLGLLMLLSVAIIAAQVDGPADAPRAGAAAEVGEIMVTRLERQH